MQEIQVCLSQGVLRFWKAGLCHWLLYEERTKALYLGKIHSLMAYQLYSIYKMPSLNVWGMFKDIKTKQNKWTSFHVGLWSIEIPCPWSRTIKWTITSTEEWAEGIPEGIPRLKPDVWPDHITGDQEKYHSWITRLHDGQQILAFTLSLYL